MFTFKNVPSIQHFLQASRLNEAQIGFVPTMGALHEGHLSLVNASRTDNDITVVSIFVNPTQFNDPKDLEKYPRNLSRDIKMLLEMGTEVVFMPEVSDIYPEGKPEKVNYDFGEMVLHMEGKHRPGHFDGVIQVMKRLLEIARPNRLYMGQKDYQQQAIIGKLIEFMGLPTELQTCPIIREADGLAMSSRNVHLNPEDRQRATSISQTLFLAREEAESLSLSTVRKNALARLDKPWFEVDYLDFVDATSLKLIDRWEEAESAVLCTTVRIGGIRLLDNVILF